MLCDVLSLCYARFLDVSTRLGSICSLPCVCVGPESLHSVMCFCFFCVFVFCLGGAENDLFKLRFSLLKGKAHKLPISCHAVGSQENAPY